MASRGDEFKPGETVPNSGIYRVKHDKEHEEAHDVTCISGKRFPPCSGCGKGVKFVLRDKAKHIEDHDLF
jgi:hypothetical protein